MNSATIRDLQYYVGKVCSIVTTSMNRNFDESISREHFVIRVRTINADGVWGSHPYKDDLLSFFNFQYIISIHQEIELDPSNPEHAKMIKDFEEKTGQKLEGDLKRDPVPETNIENDLLAIVDIEKSPELEDTSSGDATFVDILSLESLAEQSKRTFDAQDYLSKKNR